MPTVFAHAAVGWSIAQVNPRFTGKRSAALGAMALAMLPDADVLLARWSGFPEIFHHRGFTHSLAFAILAGILVATAFTLGDGGGRPSFARHAVLFTLAAASHGFFDAFTDGGDGIAFFSPFSSARFFAPIQPIPVSPLIAGAMFSIHGLSILLFEWGYFGFFTLAIWFWRDRRLWTRPSTVFTAAGALVWIVGCWVSATSERLVF